MNAPRGGYVTVSFIVQTFGISQAVVMRAIRTGELPILERRHKPGSRKASNFEIPVMVALSWGEKTIKEQADVKARAEKVEKEQQAKRAQLTLPVTPPRPSPPPATPKPALVKEEPPPPSLEHVWLRLGFILTAQETTNALLRQLLQAWTGKTDAEPVG